MHGTEPLVIIGGGPAGLGAAWRLHELGHEDWTLVESSPHVGGLAASFRDDAGFTWDLGGHVLFSHYEYFDRLMDALLGDDGWVHHQREAWCRMRERWIPYPLQNNIGRLPAEDLLACLDGLLAISRGTSPAKSPGDFRQWLLASYGQGLCDAFMFPYNFKVWAYDPAALDVGWMGERVAPVDLRRIIHNVVLQRDDTGWGPNNTFRFPLHGGTGSIWRALGQLLPAERLRLGRTVRSVDGAARRLTLDDGSTLAYGRLVNTAPLDQLLRRIVDRPDLAPQADRFVHSSTHVVGIGVEGPVPDDLRTKCWMYFPEGNCPFYRATVFSNYSQNNVARPGEQWSLMAEVSESPAKPVDARTVVESTVTGMRACGLLPADARIVSHWWRRLEYGYPTPWLGRDQVLRPIDEQLRDAGIYSRGRFGAWKYEVSNQDHSLMQGVEAVDHILFGAEETTYHYPGVVNARKNLGRRPRLPMAKQREST